MSNPNKHEDPLADNTPHEDPLVLIEGLFTDLGAAQRVETQWVIKDLLPAGLVIIGAPPKEGKSAMAMVMACLVADLNPVVLPPDLSSVPFPGKVLVFSYEATAGELKVMVEDGIHVKVPEDGRILVADDPWAWRLDDPDSVAKLLDIVSRHDPRVVILDTFRDMHDKEEKDSGEMVRMLKPIREWAVRANATVLLVHHTVKVADEVTSFDAKHLRGSGAIFGKADGVLMMTRRADGKHYIKAIFKRAKGWERTIQLALYDVKGSGSEPLEERDVLVLKALKAKATLTHIADQLHCGKQDIVNRCAKLARNGYLAKVGKKWKLTKKEVIR